MATQAPILFWSRSLASSSNIVSASTFFRYSSCFPSYVFISHKYMEIYKQIRVCNAQLLSTHDVLAWKHRPYRLTDAKITGLHFGDCVHFLKVQYVDCFWKSTRLWFVIVFQNVNCGACKWLFIKCCLMDSFLELFAEPKRLQKQTSSFQHWFWHGLSCIWQASSFYAQLFFHERIFLL